MNYSERINDVVYLLRTGHIQEGYKQTGLLLQDVLNAISSSTESNKELQDDAISGLNRIYGEVFSAMKENDIIYIVDLLKYEMYDYLNKLKKNREIMNGYL